MLSTTNNIVLILSAVVFGGGGRKLVRFRQVYKWRSRVAWI
jgi:hypothetical protein